VVVRSMELTQKKTKNVTFRQLDGVMRSIDATTGKKSSASHKCSELDTIVPQLLGISKPVLDSVLFCHQEDASWPLMEGAVLKRRFDDIFDSTRYTKALDVFRKTEKELLSKVKDIKADIAGLSSHKHAAEGFRKELREQEEIEEDLCAEKKEVQVQLDELEAELGRFGDILEKVDAASYELENARSKLGRKRMALNLKQQLVEEDYSKEHTKKQIEEILQGFDEQTSAQEKETCEGQVKQIQDQLEGLRKEEMDLQSKVGEFRAKQAAHQERVRERFAMMEKLHNDYSVELRLSASQGTNTSILAASMASQRSVDTYELLDTEDVQGFKDLLKEKHRELKEQSQDHSESMRATLESLDKALRTLEGRSSAIENGM